MALPPKETRQFVDEIFGMEAVSGQRRRRGAGDGLGGERLKSGPRGRLAAAASLSDLQNLLIGSSVSSAYRFWI